MMGGFFILGDSLTPLLAHLGEHDLSKAEAVAERLLDDAKSNAPWNDRTGAARDGLEVDVSEEGDEIVITLAHTVDYGIWLETIQSGRFAIIMPTLEKYAAEVQEAIAESFSGE